MANYSLVVNSTFQPFSYQELAAPVLEMSNYHERLAEEYDRLSSQADILEAMGSNDRDRKSGTYSRYKAYSDNLRKAADDLYRNGVNTESRQRLTDIRRMYNTEIVPIQNAWNKRSQEADMQLKALMQNPSLMFTRDARNSTLDEYIANPEGGFGVINGNNITAMMAAMAKNLEKQVRSGRKENIDDFTYNYISEFGLTPDMIRDWRNNPTIVNMFNQVMKSNGVTQEALEGSTNMQDILDKSTAYAEMGMWNAIGGDQRQIIDNFKARADYNFALQELHAANEAARKKKEEGAMPEWGEEDAGVDTKEGYVPNARGEMEALRGGKNGVKASIFGNRTGQVNPIAVYDEYKKELEKNQKIVGAGVYARNTGSEKAREKVLEKYAKYGVKDILTDGQYNILKALGYDGNTRFSGRYSDIEEGLNRLAVQNTRYSVKNAGYDIPNTAIKSNIMRLSEEDALSGMLFGMGEKGTLGSPVGVKDLPKMKDTDIVDVQYDPRERNKLLLTLSDGEKAVRVYANPELIDGKLGRAMSLWVNNGIDPRVITMKIGEWLNSYNKVQGKTDSKI